MNLLNDKINGNTMLDILNRYDLIKCFKKERDICTWISKLNKLQIDNLLSLNVEPSSIKFDTKLLINKNLLNVTDYYDRVAALISIKNADGFYHLFDKMLSPDFLNSPKFYQDIETLKRAESAQTPLWIIGEKTFIDSPYHDEDFELLVTAKNDSNRELDFILWQVIATIAGNADSIKSKYHRDDLKRIMKYGSEALQMPNSYPEGTMGNLAVNAVSLNDPYHTENMEILAKNIDIGNFLYPIMTDKQTIKKPYYRKIIQEMVEHKDNKYYAFMLCYYAEGLEKAKLAKGINEYLLDYEISSRYDMNEILNKIDEKLNTADGAYYDVVRNEIGTTIVDGSYRDITEDNKVEKITSIAKLKKILDRKK